MKILIFSMLITTNVLAARLGDCVKYKVDDFYSNVCLDYGFIDEIDGRVVIKHSNNNGCCGLHTVIPKEYATRMKSEEKSSCDNKTSCIHIIGF